MQLQQNHIITESVVIQYYIQHCNDKCQIWINSSFFEQNGCHFAEVIFKCIFMNEKFCILIPISLKFLPKGPIDNKSTPVQVMAWRRAGDKSLPWTSADPVPWRIYVALGGDVKLWTHKGHPMPHRSVKLWNTLCEYFQETLLSGVPDLWGRNKILSGGDLSHYQVPHCIRVLFYFVWFVFIYHNFKFYHTTKLLGGYTGFTPSVRPSVHPACRVRSVTSTVQDGFFPY